MDGFQEYDVSKAILDSYHEKFSRALDSEIVIVGAGPSGLVAAWRLAQAGKAVTILEKRLSPGGGIWGGSQGMNEVVIQSDALGILDEAGIRHQPKAENLHTACAMELASALCVKAIQAGAILLNLITAEDVCVHDGRVTGVVANRTLLGDTLPIDPMTMLARATIDATGHDAGLAHCLLRRKLLTSLAGEGPMDAPAGEQFVVEHVTELYPGLWTTGMSVCASQGGPRMGPIFGGMLMSGDSVAQKILQQLNN